MTFNTKTNLDKLKAAMNTKRTEFRFWKPLSNGKYLIRFLPNPDSNEVFFKGVLQHKVGEDYLWCPRTEGKPCPICEKYHALWRENTSASISLAREIKPREQYLYNIVVRQELDKVNAEPTKVYVYAAGKKLHGALMNYFWDEEYGDLTDCENGYDFILVKEDDPTGSGFPYYLNSKPRKNPSRLFADDKDIETVLGNYRPLDKEIEIKSYDELAELLAKFTNIGKEVPAPRPSQSIPADKAADDFEAGLLASLEEDE